MKIDANRGLKDFFVAVDDFSLQPEIIVCCIICYTVPTMYMADNTEISIRYVRSLNYTFYPLRDLPHKLPTTCSKQGSQHNQ